MISRKVPYSDCTFPHLVPQLVLAKIKPPMTLIDNAEQKLDCKEDISTFNILKHLMERCWDDRPPSRPSSISGC